MIIELAADFNLVIEESNFKRYHHRRTFSLPKLQNTQDTLSEKKCSRKSASRKAARENTDREHLCKWENRYYILLLLRFLEGSYILDDILRDE